MTEIASDNWRKSSRKGFQKRAWGQVGALEIENEMIE
jgi:hypothetical protein